MYATIGIAVGTVVHDAATSCFNVEGVCVLRAHGDTVVGHLQQRSSVEVVASVVPNGGLPWRSAAGDVCSICGGDDVVDEAVDRTGVRMGLEVHGEPLDIADGAAAHLQKGMSENGGVLEGSSDRRTGVADDGMVDDDRRASSK